MFVIVAPQVYIERLFRGQFVGGYLEFFFTRVLELRPYPEGDFSWHHLWFIAYLYVYVVALIPALFWWKHARIQLRPGLWLFALGVPLGVNEALLKPFFPEAHNLLGDWYIFNHYLLLTIYGFLLASVSGSWDWLERRRRIALGLALTVLMGALASFRTGVIERDTAADALIANLFTWFSLMTFLGYGRRYLSYSNRLLVWARDASYPIYILHQTVIIVLAWYIVAQPWSAGVKYVVVLIGTMLACVLIYEVCIRRFGVMRLAFGMKRESRSAAGQNTQVSASRVLIR
jgi:peptidoglycan/LPS O-acetylase OafA/YrhL